MRNVSDLNTEELISELKRIAKQCQSKEEFQKTVNIELSGISVTIAYYGESFHGMAMSHHHVGSIYFRG